LSDRLYIKTGTVRRRIIRCDRERDKQKRIVTSYKIAQQTIETLKFVPFPK